MTEKRTVANVVAHSIADQVLALPVQLRAVLLVLRQVPVVVADDPGRAIELLQERPLGDARLRQQRGCKDGVSQHCRNFYAFQTPEWNRRKRKEVEVLQVIVRFPAFRNLICTCSWVNPLGATLCKTP